jgi:hypothetical protein
MAGEPRIATGPGSAPRFEFVLLIGPVPALSGYEDRSLRTCRMVPEAAA